MWTAGGPLETFLFLLFEVFPGRVSQNRTMIKPSMLVATAIAAALSARMISAEPASCSQIDHYKTGEGFCDWHYKDLGQANSAGNTLQGCADACRAEQNCRQFSFGATLGCRYSSCGSYAQGACPDDKQCPILTEHETHDGEVQYLHSRRRSL